MHNSLCDPYNDLITWVSIVVSAILQILKQINGSLFKTIEEAKRCIEIWTTDLYLLLLAAMWHWFWSIRGKLVMWLTCIGRQERPLFPCALVNARERWGRILLVPLLVNCSIDFCSHLIDQNLGKSRAGNKMIDDSWYSTIVVWSQSSPPVEDVGPISNRLVIAPNS